MPNRRPLYFLAAALTVLPVAIAAGQSTQPLELSARIDALFRSLANRSVRSAVVVRDASSGAIVFSANASTPMIPASNQKLFVLAAAVDVLGPAFEFRTVFALRGKDLVVIGDGDPGFGDPRLCDETECSVTAVFKRWADALIRMGYADGSGDIIIDETLFDDQTTHPSWEADDLQRWYAAPVGALNLHDNCIQVSVWPNGASGAAPFWSITPPASGIEIVNRARSERSGVPVISRRDPSFQFVISGSCGSHVDLAPVAVPDPGGFFADVLSTALTRVGISLSGRIRRERVRNDDGSLPSDVRIIADHRTSLKDVLARIGKNSQNLFADCLVKRLGYEHMRRAGHKPARGSWISGAAAITAFLNRCGIDTTGLVLADASGLSRDNRATAAQISAVLLHMSQHADRALFMDNLAVAGRDGSLRKRMGDLAGRVAGKTGTLRGVTALSGYATDPAGRRFVFSTMFNGFTGGSAPYKRIQDDLCRLLVTGEQSVGP